MSPLLGCDDAIAFLPRVDCVLFVVASGETKVADVKEARRLLGKTRSLGTVLNKSRTFGADEYYRYEQR
ncbi:MAG: hypothetical protein K2Q06_08950, partial [Parvularculaceae bacterium]|nr:hypothetical protein [Parvularculaceae bacterium]